MNTNILEDIVSYNPILIFPYNFKYTNNQQITNNQYQNTEKIWLLMLDC